jgi:hypothetical protein
MRILSIDPAPLTPMPRWLAPAFMLRICRPTLRNTTATPKPELSWTFPSYVMRYPVRTFSTTCQVSEPIPDVAQ